jgi:L-serine dehydratase
MTASVFEMFRVGIGPSSSHTVGPMRAARQFVQDLSASPRWRDVDRVRVELYGSLAATGIGHGTDRAIVLGFSGATPDAVERVDADAVMARHASTGTVALLGGRTVFYGPKDLVYHRERLAGHSNGMSMHALGSDDEQPLHSETFYSIGGGTVLRGDELGQDDHADVPYPFSTAGDLLELCDRLNASISAVVRRNEEAQRAPAQVSAYVQTIWQVMQECVLAGLNGAGVLPGPLGVPRRAPDIYRRLLQDAREGTGDDPLVVLDWVSAFAMAVNEENASGGRIVTAPTNGAAGVVPAVLHYYLKFVPGADADGVERFLLCASAIGSLIKQNASISGAEMGCQGEVGSACAMAAAGLCEVSGGSPRQVENAAEIALEHHLGMTCDPVGGLVQIPCIERNAVGAVKAISAARLALGGTGIHTVSLDMAIRTMRATGMDMKAEYKETSRGGLAVNVIEC